MKTVRKGRVLCFTSYYLPGFKSGGPLRSLIHIQQWLRDEYEFMVVTRDRDFGDAGPYEGMRPSEWHAVEGSQVLYLAAPHWSPKGLRRAVQESRPGLLYFQGCFDPALTIVPLMLRRLGWLPRSIPVLLAPRGQFSRGARSIKRIKKNVFLLFAKAIGLYENVTWHATKNEEADEIRALWGKNVRVLVAPNLPSKLDAGADLKRPPKQPNALRLVFLSRICRMKNLQGALEILQGVQATVEFDIYGTQEDAGYWDECRRLIGRLPGNVQARYKGSVSPGDVVPVLAGYDALLLPTLGENFGHVILEALSAGCPVLLSDQTPWRQLSAAQVGFDIPLDQPHRFRQVIEQWAAMDGPEFQRWSTRAREYALRYSNDAELVQQTRGMLATAMLQQSC